MDELDDGCIHGLGPVSACVLCNGRAKADERTEGRPSNPRIFPAKFEGQCPGCNLPIRFGQDVAWVPDYPAMHEECWTS